MLYTIIAGSTNFAQKVEQSTSVAAQVNELLRRILPGDAEATTTPPSLVHHTTTTFTTADMGTRTMVTSSALPEEDEEISATLINNATDKEPRQSRPKLCINGVEVNLNTNDDMVIRKTTTVVESYSKVVATPSVPKPVEPISTTIPTTTEAYVEAIFGPMPVVAPLFSTPPPSPVFTPPPSPSINASSITPIAASASTAPIEACGFIEPIFGSESSDQGFGMFYTPSVVPCKREGTPLEKDNGKAQEKV